MEVRQRVVLGVHPLEDRSVPAGDLVRSQILDNLGVGSFTRTATDTIGNVYIAGTFSGTFDVDPSATVRNLVSKGGTDVFVAKYAPNGSLVWARQLGGTGSDSAADVTFDGAGNVYTAGTFNGTVDFDPSTTVTRNFTAATGGSAFAWKLDFYGNYFLARTVAGVSSATSIAVAPTGNMFVSGQFRGTADFDPGVGIANLTTTNPLGSTFVWRLEGPGNLGYARAFHTTGMIESSAIAVDGAGNVYLGGRFTGEADFDPSAGTFKINGGPNWSAYVTKLNYFGNLWWTKTTKNPAVAGSSTAGVVGLGFDPIGNVYAVGNFTGTVDFDPGSATVNLSSAAATFDAFAWKLDLYGNYLWARRFGGNGTDQVTDSFTDQSGNTYLVGHFNAIGDFDPGTGTAHLVPGNGGPNGFLVKLDAVGALRYARSIGGGSSRVTPTGVWADLAGNIQVTGNFLGTADFNPGTLVETGTSTVGGSGFSIRILPPVGATPKSPNTGPTAVTAGGPYVIAEGQGLTVQASAVDLEANPLTFSWDLNGDGVYGDVTGSRPTLTAAQMAALGLNDSRGPITIRVRVTDGVNLPVVATSTLTINNVPPTATLSVPSLSVRIGNTLLLTVLTPSDPSTADRTAGFRYSYDFNNDGTFDLGSGATYAASVTANRVTVPASNFAVLGPRTMRVRIFDKDGGFSDRLLTVNVVP